MAKDNKPTIDLLSSVNDGNAPVLPPEESQGDIPPVEGDASPPDAAPEPPPSDDKTPRELDRSRDFGTIVGASSGAVYEQDGIQFNGLGIELESK